MGLKAIIIRRLIDHLRKFIINLFETTSAHGLRHLVRYGVHMIERFVWITCISIGIFGVVALAQRIWYRYQTSPVVISMDRNMYFWNTSFPSLTVCSQRRIDERKVELYIESHPDQFADEGDAEDFKEFIFRLANASYDTFLDLPMHKNYGIDSSDYLDLIYNLSWPFQPSISTGTTLHLDLQPTVTELGLCLSVNSRIAEYNSYHYWKNQRWDIVPSKPTVVVHPLDGEVYGQLIKLENSYEVYFHGYLEVPEISKRRYSFMESFYTTVELLALEIKTSPRARELSVSQRQCRFTHEAEILQFSPVYSYNQCRVECRMRLAVKYCGCVPHFYRHIGKGNFKYRICDFDGYRCLGENSGKIIDTYVLIKLWVSYTIGIIQQLPNVRYKMCQCCMSLTIYYGFNILIQPTEALITLRSKKQTINCNCVPNCDDSNFFVHACRSREWFLGANLQWGLTDYPKMQLNRDIIFGLSDVLVYIGGLGGFFLGCSLITFTEFIYFFAWRLFKRQD